MAVEFRVGATELGATQAGADVAREAQRAAQAAAQDAARQARLEAEQAVREMQQQAAQAQREAEQARREAEQAVREAQQEAREAIREAQSEVRVDGPPPWVRDFPGGPPQVPEGVIIISIAFFAMCAIIAIGYPLARAFGRRMDRKGAVAAQDPDARMRLERIEHAVDAIALEVERISEGQRFTSKVLADLRALPEPDPAAALATPMLRARERR